MITVVFKVITDDFFNGHFSVTTIWNFPHLPRKGERIHPLLLIGHESFDWESAYSMIKDEFKKDFEADFVTYGGGNREEYFKSWLWDCMCEFNTVDDIQYNPSKDNSGVLPIVTLS